MPKRKPVDRKHHSHERTMNSYDRQAGKRPPAQNILIVCEGAETEPNYFKSLREYLKLPTVNVKVKDRAGAPISVVKEAEALVKKRQEDIRDGRTRLPPFEAVWCVFDVENPHDNQSFNSAICSADQNAFQLAVSNPAFEYWYVLHFELTTRPFANGDELKDYLRRHIPGYHPAKSVFYDLVTSTLTAIRFAQRILDNHPQGDQRFPNPSTGVHLLVIRMFEMSSTGCERVK